MKTIVEEHLCETVNNLIAERNAYKEQYTLLKSFVGFQDMCVRDLREKLAEAGDTINKLQTERDDLSYELSNVPDNFLAGVDERDAIIKRRKAVIDRQKNIIIDLTDGVGKLLTKGGEYQTTIDKLCEQLHNQANTIGGLVDKQHIEDCWEEELDRLEHVISARDMTIESLTTMCQSSGSIRKKLASTIDERESVIKGLNTNIINITQDRDKWRQSAIDAEDAKTLMEVVKIVNDDRLRCTQAMNRIADTLVDYLDAPEG